MTKLEFDQEALAKQFAQASARQGEAVRRLAEQFTLQALRSRELTTKNIRAVLKAATQAASSGVAQEEATEADMPSLLAQAMEGMDAALVQAVEANRRALQQLVDQGAALREPRIKSALADIKGMEDVLFDTVTKAVRSGVESIQAPWSTALGGAKLKGSVTGTTANAAIGQLTERAHEALRNGRTFHQRSVGLWMEHYAALVSGVFIGMTDASSVDSESKQAAARQ